jgi:FkbM family methyltransferase
MPLLDLISVALRPKPLRKAANSIVRAIAPSRMNRFGATICVNPSDPVVTGALLFGLYENTECRYFASRCRPGMTVLDIGANTGLYTAIAIRKLAGQGRIIALEPDPENFGYLEKTIAANGSSNVTCLRKAAADHHGSMTLFVSPDNRGDNRLYAHDPASREVQVEVAPVDAILAALGVDQVDLVKMDVQGFEGHVLKGMGNTLRTSRSIEMLLEFWPLALRGAGSDPVQVLTLLLDADLELFELDAKGQLRPLGPTQALVDRYPGSRYANIVALRRSGSEKGRPW